MTYAEVRREGRRSVGKAYVRRWIRAEGANPVANQQGYGGIGHCSSLLSYASAFALVGFSLTGLFTVNVPYGWSLSA
jgi:hypothetical protein